MKKLKFIALLLTISLILVGILATTGCLEEPPNDEEATTGAIEVKYSARPGDERDVVIYLENDGDPERLGQIRSDRWVTFEDIEPGQYKIFAENLDGLLLDSRGITVYRGQTTKVELSW